MWTHYGGLVKHELFVMMRHQFMQMDKASIVGDAVVYLQELQMQAKKLKAEVASLESSLTRGDKCQGGNIQATSKMNATNFYPVIKKILKVLGFTGLNVNTFGLKKILKKLTIQN